jgi:hypothetical protein
MSKPNSCEERELWLCPRVSGLLLEEMKLWPSMDSTSDVAMWQP